MANNEILTIDFQLRKPYNEAEMLVEAFNQIISEGGRFEILIMNNNIFQLKMYRCRNSYSSASLGAKLKNKLTKSEIIKISKLNFASSFYSPAIITLKPTETNNGPTITISLYEHKNKDIQSTIIQNFKLMDIAFAKKS